ncbi:monosaccharide ABC transporter substrate-binding protein, CUT2 family [Jannaschia faecimaris]|uniref:Monosaccharide ABC transporter substrate-binding protein, CUT2 family n=1 Tax=Jannaschia faecimaris TaxID=1244108 RepID=A0A1H3PW43_9RHOB|nr:LacI family DNA-binding transcriptional regulator [Jannaschia faecimaris]SDZ05173.1 monosaccharide ABC transporter substrate-binding protein, CUT2 family [Jannaschia faecimaris]
MPHRFLIKDIALQAGLGPATVDRVLNGRGGVRRQTADRVRRAIAELEAQAAQLALSGRKMMIDLVVEAPQSFLDALDGALALELPLLGPPVVRARADLRARFNVEGIAAQLDRIGRRGSHGVILMAPDAEPVAAAVARLTGRGIPVVTLASDMPDSGRIAYVGLDNARAGRTAAWFMGRWLRGGAARVLVTLRNPRFRGEGERLEAFRAALPAYLPRATVDVLREDGDGPAFDAAVARAAARPIDALYSIGGGNRRLLAQVEARQARPLLIAHDLDPENHALTAEGRIDLLIYHDFRADLRAACQLFVAVMEKRPLPPLAGAALHLLAPPLA